MTNRLLLPALLVIAAIAAWQLFGSDPIDDPTPTTNRGTKETDPAEARTTTNEQEPQPQDAVPTENDLVQQVPDADWIEISALPESIRHRVNSVLREVRAAHIRVGQRLPQEDPRTTLELAQEVLRRHTRWIESRGELRERYGERFEIARAQAPLDNHGTYERPSEFEAMMRNRFGSDFDRKRGHLFTRPAGDRYEWYYFPPGAIPELDEIKEQRRGDPQYQFEQLYAPLSQHFKWR